MIEISKSHRLMAEQFIKFGIIGTFGFLIDFSFFHIGLDLLGFGKYWSAIFSFPFAVTFTWLGNRVFTFRGPQKGRASTQWARFFIACAIGFTINRGTYSLLITMIPFVYGHPVLGLVAGTLVAMFFNFFAARQVVFR